jgi:hypothetical protein
LLSPDISTLDQVGQALLADGVYSVGDGPNNPADVDNIRFAWVLLVPGRRQARKPGSAASCLPARYQTARGAAERACHLGNLEHSVWHRLRI